MRAPIPASLRSPIPASLRSPIPASLRSPIAFVIFAGCHAPPSELPQGVVLRYGVSYMGGTTTFEVKADGSAEYASHGGPQGEKRVHAKATAEEIHAVAEVLRKNSFCSLTSGRKTGIPDEARPTIRAHVENVDCSVTLWDGEWRDDSHAHACLEAVETFGAALASRGSP